MKPSIIFVYNGQSGIINTLLHVAHKMFSPQTYECNLCAITNSPIGMRKEWKEFLNSLGFDYEFIHTDELATKYQITNIKLPAIFIKKDQAMELRIAAPAINNCHTMDCLQKLILEGID